MYFIRNDSMASLESYFVFAEKKEWREAKKIQELSELTSPLMYTRFRI